MRSFFYAFSIILSFAMTDHIHAEPEVFEDFENGAEQRWRFVSDRVMGGLSDGNLDIIRHEAGAFARLKGNVSTDNNGGFIQFRRTLEVTLPANTREIRLQARGNGQRYFVHLRTTGTILPWQYYQAGFDVRDKWSEIVLPLDAFKASGRMMRSTPSARSIKSIGIVAFGRDHTASIDVKDISFR